MVKIVKGNIVPDDDYEFINDDGYRIMHLAGQGDYHAEDLAFLSMTGEWPKGRVEFLDGDKTNCRWANLRDTGEGTPASLEGEESE
jgi:hypothetical protein